MLGSTMRVQSIALLQFHDYEGILHALQFVDVAILGWFNADAV